MIGDFADQVIAFGHDSDHDAVARLYFSARSPCSQRRSSRRRS